MSILIDKTTRVLIQGITGKQGQKATVEMAEYNTEVVCGVTPGKGGQEVCGKPVYNSIKEALEKHSVNTSLVYVPPFAVKDAVFEAIDNGIKLINVITEKVPVLDTAKIYAYANKHGAMIIGPSSVGIISPGKAKLGCVGGGDPSRVYIPGNIGVISKSGGMSSETSLLLKENGIGQSTVVGIGGDVICCSTFTDILELFEKDDETKAVVIFGEVGGTYEEPVAEMVNDGKFTKPIIAFISGQFSEMLPSGAKLGHAGAIIANGVGTYKSKVTKLREAGCIVAKAHHHIPKLVKQATF
jgi:succinyl-CoA synthetase alpha subunit